MVAGDHHDAEMPDNTHDFIDRYFPYTEDDGDLFAADPDSFLPDEHSVFSEPSGTTDSDNASFHSQEYAFDAMEEMPPGPHMEMGPPSPVQNDIVHPPIDFGSPQEFQGPFWNYQPSLQPSLLLSTWFDMHISSLLRDALMSSTPLPSVSLATDVPPNMLMSPFAEHPMLNWDRLSAAIVSALYPGASSGRIQIPVVSQQAEQAQANSHIDWNTQGFIARSPSPGWYGQPHSPNAMTQHVGSAEAYHATLHNSHSQPWECVSPRGLQQGGLEHHYQFAQVGQGGPQGGPLEGLEHNNRVPYPAQYSPYSSQHASEYARVASPASASTWHSPPPSQYVHAPHTPQSGFQAPGAAGYVHPEYLPTSPGTEGARRMQAAQLHPAANEALTARPVVLLSSILSQLQTGPGRCLPGLQSLQRSATCTPDGDDPSRLLLQWGVKHRVRVAPGKYVYMCLVYEFADCRLAVPYLEGKKKEGRTFADAGIAFSVKLCVTGHPGDAAPYQDDCQSQGHPSDAAAPPAQPLRVIIHTFPVPESFWLGAFHRNHLEANNDILQHVQSVKDQVHSSLQGCAATCAFHDYRRALQEVLAGDVQPSVGKRKKQDPNNRFVKGVACKAVEIDLVPGSEKKIHFESLDLPKTNLNPSLLLAAASITSGEEGAPDSTLCSLLAVPMVRTSRDASNRGDLVRRAAVEKQGYPEYEYKHHILPLVADKNTRW